MTDNSLRPCLKIALLGSKQLALTSAIATFLLLLLVARRIAPACLAVAPFGTLCFVSHRRLQRELQSRQHLADRRPRVHVLDRADIVDAVAVNNALDDPEHFALGVIDRTTGVAAARG